MKDRLVLVSIVIAFAAGLLNAQRFTNPVLIPTSQYPTSIFVADLNGDGRPDLLYETSGLNSTPGTMETLLAQASGGYVPGPSTTVPVLVGGCRPADVNDDGRQDLVCLNFIDECHAKIVAFVGNGDGTFQFPIYSGLMESICNATFFPSLNTPSKVNSDSFPDLTVDDPYNGEFFVLVGDGTGRFNVSGRYFGSAQYGGERLTPDLNGDGKPDIFSSGNSFVYLGNGDGTFTEGKSYGPYLSCNLYDFDADGHLDAVCDDLFIPSTDSLAYELDLLHGNADGSFNTTPLTSLSLQGGFGAIKSPTAVLDINGDGIPDILGSSTDGLSVFLGEPNLKYRQSSHYAVGNFGGIGSTTSQIVDLNNDGYQDIICTGTGGLYVSYGKKDGTYAAPPAFPVADSLGAMTVADFNGDGILDIAATGDANIKLSFGNGDGTFQPPVALPNGSVNFSAPSFAFSIAHGNFRGNGQQDILVIGTATTSTYQYDSYLLFNHGNGTFSEPQQLANSTVQLPYFESFTIADFNLDGRDDFLTTSSNFQTVYVGLSNGDGTFNTVATAVPFASVVNPTYPAIADFNKDGKPDIVYLSGANAYVLKGNGDGSFKPGPLLLPIPPYQGQSLYYRPLATATGDFDGDGNPDFAVLAQVGGYLPPPAPVSGNETAVYVFYGNGDGTFAGPMIAGAFNKLYDTIYSADLNKDGRSDLILEITGIQASTALPGDTVGVVISEPGRLFGPEAVYTAGMQATGTFVADVNRDGLPDLLVSNSSFFEGGYLSAGANSVTELLNLGAETNPNRLTSSTNLVASSQSFVAGTSISFTATVSGAPSSGSAPSGSVRFADQTGVETNVPLVASGSTSATATLTTNMIGAGADTMRATYSGDDRFAPSFGTVPLTALGLPDDVTISVKPGTLVSGNSAILSVTVSNPASSTAATPTGYIEFRDGSRIIGGPNTLSSGSTTYSTPSLTAGSHTLSARYSGDLIHVANTATATVHVLAQPGFSFTPPQPAVSSTQDASIVVTVTAAGGLATPTGSVVLSANGFTSQAATLSAGSATVAIPAGALPPGGYWLAATYTPDASSSGSYATTTEQNAVYLAITSLPPGFTVSGTAVTVAPGATTGNTSIITITPSNGFVGNVTLSAAIASGPAGAQHPPVFQFGPSNPTSISGASPATITLTVSTTAPSARAMVWPAFRGSGRKIQKEAILACLLFVGLLPRRRRWRSIGLMVMLLTVLEIGLTACGGGSGGSVQRTTSNLGTSAGTYIVTITGTSGAITANNTITVVVE